MDKKQAPPSPSAAQKQPAPDGGYGWIIVFAAFVINATMSFTFGTFGVYYLPFYYHFYQDRHLVVWTHSALMVTGGLAATVSGVLVRKIGYKKLTAIGGMCYFTGCLMASLAPHVSLVIFGFGVVLGLGNSFAFMSSVVAVQDYFNKRRALAQGLALFGSSAAMFSAPPLVQHLIDSYGWRGSLLIQSAIMLHAVPAALLLRSLVPPVRKTLSIRMSDTTDDVDVRLDNDKHIVQFDPSIPDKQNTMSEDKMQIDSLTTLKKEKKQGFWKGVFDFSLLLNQHFLLFTLVNFTFQLGLNVPLVFQIPRAVSLGVRRQTAALIGSAYGIGNLASRIPIGLLGDRVDRRVLYGVLNASCGAITVICSFIYPFPVLVAYAAALGFLSGGFIMITAPTAVDLVGVERIHKGQGLTMLTNGVASMSSAPFAGLLYQLTQSYDLAFLSVGILMALGGGAMAALYITIRIRDSCCKIKTYKDVPTREI